jgi:hypothetical protein
VKYSVTTSYGSRTSLNTSRGHRTHNHDNWPDGGYGVSLPGHSRDASGILVTSYDNTFTTKAAPVSVSVSPQTASVTSGGIQQFAATVANSSNQSVTWSTTGGTISTAGLFTAPAVTADQTVTVKASSVADTSKSGSATVTVRAPLAALSVNPTNLTFTGQQGGANPAANALSISNTGAGTLTYGAAADVAWVTVPPASETAPSTLQVDPSIVGLVPGTYTGHITISAPGAANSPTTVLVSLTIAALTIQHSVDLSWNASSSGSVVSYSAYRSTTQGGSYILVASAITGLSYTDTRVQSGLTYFYVVTAFDDRAQESVYSNEANAVVP